MRIFYLSSNLGVHDQRLLRSLAGTDHEVFLITHYHGKDLPQKIMEIKGISIINYNNPLAFSAGAEREPVMTRKIKCWTAFTKSLLRLKRDIKLMRPDVIHAGWTDAEGFLARLSGFRPILSMTWGSDVLVVPEMSWRLRVKTRYTLSRADLIWSDCENVKGQIIKLINCRPEKIKVFPRGVDLGRFNQNVDVDLIRKKLRWQNKKIVLMTRSFKEIYGIEYFLRALPEIVKDCPDARVILAGDGPLMDKFQALVNDLKLKEIVHFAGFINNQDLPAYYNSADVYVSSSLSDGTSNSLLEAMACGLPLVLSDVPSYCEWVADGHNGYIVPRKDSQQLADRIIRLLKNKDQRRLFGSRNLEIARQRADWGKNFGKLEEIYRELVGIRNNA